MWAMRRIGHLTEVAQANDNNKEVVDEIVELSKHYGIISAYTSFLATDPNEGNRFRQASARPTTLDNSVGWAPGSGVSIGGGGGSGAASFRSINPRRLGSAGFSASSGARIDGHNRFTFAPQQLQIADGRPVTRDMRSSPVRGMLIPPPPAASGLPSTSWGKSVASSGDNAYMSGAEGVAGLPPYFEFSKNQRVALGLNTNAAAPRPEEKKNERRAGSYLPDARGGDELDGALDWSTSGTRASESKQLLAKAMSSAEVSGKKAVETQKVLNKLKSGELDKDTASGAVKVIGEKTFYLVNGFWVDSNFEKMKDPKPEEIEFGSQKYFDLVKADSAISKYLGAGPQVILIFKDKCYKIVSPEVKTASTT
jgi:hypothetical protein